VRTWVMNTIISQSIKLSVCALKIRIFIIKEVLIYLDVAFDHLWDASAKIQPTPHAFDRLWKTAPQIYNYNGQLVFLHLWDASTIIQRRGGFEYLWETSPTICFLPPTHQRSNSWPQTTNITNSPSKTGQNSSTITGPNQAPSNIPIQLHYCLIASILIPVLTCVICLSLISKSFHLSIAWAQ